MPIIPNADQPGEEEERPVQDVQGRYRFNGWRLASEADVGAPPATPQAMLNVDDGTGMLHWNKRTVSQPEIWSRRSVSHRNLKLFKR
jgi:hypothetical protein